MTSYYCTEKGGWVGTISITLTEGTTLAAQWWDIAVYQIWPPRKYFVIIFPGKENNSQEFPHLCSSIFFTFNLSRPFILSWKNGNFYPAQCRKNCEWPHYYFQLLPGLFETCPLYPEKKFRYHSITIVQQLFYAVVGVVVYLMSLSNIWFCRSLPQP